MVAGNSAEAEKALQDELDKPERETGEIILVGAGPGDAGLLTLRGLQAIQQADVVFHDHLVTQPVLELVRRDAELICVGKRAGEHSVPQHETNQLLVEAAKARENRRAPEGRRSVYFGRGAEELQAAAEAGIPFGGAGRHRSRRGDGLRRYSADPSRLCAKRRLCHRPL